MDAKMTINVTFDWNAIVTRTQKLEKHIRQLKSQSGNRKNVDLLDALKDYTADCLHDMNMTPVEED